MPRAFGSCHVQPTLEKCAPLVQWADKVRVPAQPIKNEEKAAPAAKESGDKSHAKLRRYEVEVAEVAAKVDVVEEGKFAIERGKRDTGECELAKVSK
jgi:hypothetical protein